MKNLIVFLLLVSGCWLALANQAKKQSVGSLEQRVVASGGGGGLGAFSDDFNRANSDSLGSNWTEGGGDGDIASNTYVIGTGGFGVVNSVHNTSCGSVTQYAMVTLGVNHEYPWLIFRYTDASSPFYAVQISGSTALCEWYYFTSAADSSGDLIGTVDIGGDLTGHTVAMTCSGTGTSTVITIWRQVTGLPSAAGNWNGDTTPDGTISNDPASPKDTGNFVGIGGQAVTGGTVTLDNFFGGGL